jgi:glycosyltransferase involved in cell wall biosynthesis
MANQTRQLTRLLREEGVDVRVLQTNPPYSPMWVSKLPGMRALFRLVPYLWRLKQEIAKVNVVHVMANSGWAWFLFAAPAIHIAAWRGVPVLVNYRGGLAEEFLSRSAHRVLPTLRRARIVAVPSSFLNEVFSAHGISTVIIPNVVDTGTFQPADLSVEVLHSPHVVITRNLEAIYGIDTALRALAIVCQRVTGLRVSIAGSGPDRQALETLTASLGLSDRVHFTGRLEVQGMVDLYRSAHVVLNPSRADNMPNSVLEALACGVPVVSTNVGGVRHIVEHGRTAWLVPPDDPEQMAQGIERLIRDEALRIRLRDEGLSAARRYGWSEVREQWLDAYRHLAA